MVKVRVLPVLPIQLLSAVEAAPLLGLVQELLYLNLKVVPEAQLGLLERTILSAISSSDRLVLPVSDGGLAVPFIPVLLVILSCPRLGLLLMAHVVLVVLGVYLFLVLEVASPGLKNPALLAVVVIAIQRTLALVELREWLFLAANRAMFQLLLLQGHKFAPV